MSVIKTTLVAAALAALLGCSAPAPDELDKEDAEALGRDTDETVFDDAIQTQDRARAVEDLTLGRKDDMDDAIERSEGEASGEE